MQKLNGRCERIIPGRGLKINCVQMFISPKLIYKYNVFIKLMVTFMQKIKRKDKTIPSCT